jgi:glyoxylase-like metal-dependent hydrolase (beta-lactamase superfamily II)
MKQVLIEEPSFADHVEEHGSYLCGNHAHTVCEGVAYQRVKIVNVAFLGDATRWVLVDTGLPGAANSIREAATERFGEGARPAAIIMTHAHSDHAGSVEKLAEEWQVPVYAHPLEEPYLIGAASYPAPDPKVGGGVMSALSVLFPRGPVNIRKWLKMLPEDHTVPFLENWVWLHTPGHTPGHVSLWRESDRTLIAGDAFITTNQESLYAVVTQRPELHGPPMFYTQNWMEAEASVKRLSMLQPEVALCGHGRPMRGPRLRQGLKTLAINFRRIAVPQHGKYVDHPATVLEGNAYVKKN